MGKNILIEALRANDKTGYLFETNSTFVGYKTGFPGIDYGMGFTVNVFDKDGNFDHSYPSLGVATGSIVTIIGKSHTGKTTLAIQMASNIVRSFDNGVVMHYDLEGGTNMTRVGILSKFTPQEMKEGKYILRQVGASIEEIKMTIAKLYTEKTSNPKDYTYDTGLVDEFGEKIIAYVPTCLIIDSVPSLTTYINENTKDGQKTLEEISSQTDKMRLTAEIGRFFTESMQMMKASNIIMFLINHIKTKPGMGVPQQADLRYLKQDETMPAGRALQYYTNTMFRLTSVGSEKYTLDTDNFDGFGVQLQFVKNRGNVDGTIVPLVFDKVHGYDSLRSSFMHAKSLGMISGNRNGFYFSDLKDKKFRFDTIHSDFATDRTLYNDLYSRIIPVLESGLSSVKPEEMIVVEEEMNY